MPAADRREIIPLDRIDPAPWNRKHRIAGDARDGLKASLEHFGVRDDLKVWPDPANPGRYIALDGNQRLDVLRESGAAEVECRVLADLDDEDARLFNAAFDRNRAFYDETKLSELAREAKAAGAVLVARLLRLSKVNLPEPECGPEVAAEALESTAQVPLLFSLTREGYHEVKGSLLRSKQRLIRERRLREAFAAFEASEIDDMVAETVLRLAAQRMAK